MGLDDFGTELDWVLLCSKNQILFYDELQSVKPSDVPKEKFDKLISLPTTKVYKLETQFRCKAGDEYVQYIRDVLSTAAGVYPFFTVVARGVQSIRSDNAGFMQKI